MKKFNLFVLAALLFIALVYSCNANDSITSVDESNFENTSKVFLNNSAKDSDEGNFSYINSNEPVLKRFLESKTYERHKDYISSWGDIDLNTVQYKEYDVEGKNYDFFVLSIFKDGKLAGKLEVLDLKDTPFLPNDDKYALNYADLSSYNMDEQAGSIKLYDLNYDNFMHTKMDIVNGYYTNVEGNGLSDELKEKYAYLANPNKSANLTSRHFCDSNGNGNISFGECYGCIVRAIKQNSTSTAICHSYEAMGLPWWGSCGASVVVSCTIISSIS